MDTRKFISEVYDKVSSGEPDVKEAEKAVGEQIRQMAAEHRGRFSDSDTDIILDMLYSVQTISMREGYILGTKHAAELLCAMRGAGKVSRLS